jgi:hypothetical protein
MEPEFDVVVPIIVGVIVAVLVAWALHLGVFADAVTVPPVV